MIASVTPAAAAISRVVVAPNPLREKRSMATSMSWLRRSVAAIRAAGAVVIGIPIVSKYLLVCKKNVASLLCCLLLCTSQGNKGMCRRDYVRDLMGCEQTGYDVNENRLSCLWFAPRVAFLTLRKTTALIAAATNAPNS